MQFGSGYSNSRNGQYDTALICENGHIINSSSLQYPEDNMRFCSKCGSKTLNQCPTCNTPIRGSNITYHSVYILPAFCHNCGNSFIWTQHKIESAIEIAFESDNINQDDKEIFKKALPEIVKDTSRTPIESIRIGKIIKKIGNGTSNMIKDIIIGIITETAKNAIFPNK
jgi:hypothetical protein